MNNLKREKGEKQKVNVIGTHIETDSDINHFIQWFSLYGLHNIKTVTKFSE